MRALAKTDETPGELEVIDLATPEPGADEVSISVVRVGLCGTDVGIQHWAPGLVQEYRPTLPHVLGHEFSGIVVDVGSDVDRRLCGRRVTANPHLPCGNCRHCTSGRSNICQRRPILGCHVAGAAADLAAVKATNIHILPDDMPFEVGALVEPTAVALHAVERAGVQPGETVGVVGAGPIGVLCSLVLRAQGHDPILSGLPEDAPRLALAADRGVRTMTEPLEDVDVVVEAAGSPSAVQAALSAVAAGGKLVIVSLPHDVIELNVTSLVFRELTLLGSRAYTPDVWPRAVALLSENLSAFTGLVAPPYCLEDWREALRAVADREAMKVQLALPGSSEIL